MRQALVEIAILQQQTVFAACLSFFSEGDGLCFQRDINSQGEFRDRIPGVLSIFRAILF